MGYDAPSNGQRLNDIHTISTSGTTNSTATSTTIGLAYSTPSRRLVRLNDARERRGAGRTRAPGRMSDSVAIVSFRSPATR
ncbi:hypothetical protein GCM10009634_84020 [Saccharothrix xinjiangensis]